MVDESPNIEVLIMAAGASKRMGRAKQLLPWGHTFLLGHIIQTALQLQSGHVTVVLGDHYDNIKKKIVVFPVNVVYNDEWHLGLGKSIACGIEYINQSKRDVDGVMIVLADQPFVTPEFLNTLIKSFRSGEKVIVATSYGSNQTGVPVIFDKNYFAALLELNDDKGAKHLLEKHKDAVRLMKTSEDMVDLDTKEVYDAMLKEAFKI
ncbi:nucleotidyltransferase family protein [Snuella sedimenti]|uniref:Nucleotidyltransferase family protein n=1 Tax=Snuella sedimenti TaxID=2798802 RepID=A0A8J7LSF5_9FLAO|nr:nucleotidyltransferase family protein [Snuella sedimenti]MBJ6367236.1 nucleotidyltransferase family protein [Snuella sedimenti]